MSYNNDPANNPIDRVRLNVGDILECPFMGDEVYEYLLTKHSGNERQAALEAARYLLGTFAKYTRERAGDLEVFGAEFFKNYRQFLLDLIENPNFNFINAMPYAGGISQEDMRLNNNNTDTALRKLFIGVLDDNKSYTETVR